MNLIPFSAMTRIKTVIAIAIFVAAGFLIGFGMSSHWWCEKAAVAPIVVRNSPSVYCAVYDDGSVWLESNNGSKYIGMATFDANGHVLTAPDCIDVERAK